ncbi:MAG: type III PLP-dependent enzyme, partial [Alphaproteobacteria bacterium]
MERYQNAACVAQALNPSHPVLCRRPARARNNAAWFCANFPGRTFYAVKANPAPWMLEALSAGGITHFDVASIAEARLVRALFPQAVIGFMHPVKPVATIAEAYFRLGVRLFALDSRDELAKIQDATGNADDLSLCVRIAVPSDTSKISLSAKFGIGEGPDAPLLQAVRQVARRLVVSFHVGSQAMAPSTFRGALARVQSAIVRAGVFVDAIDVGGGFPAHYPGMVAPPLADYVHDIVQGFRALSVGTGCELWCEPGRALAADAAALIVRVEHRRGADLFINDGVYGTLFDAGPMGWTYPVRLLGRESGAEPVSFAFYGPTCDDYDRMEGPFHLPGDTDTGDLIEIDTIGAYGAAMRTSFNGFEFGEDVNVDDH